LSNPERGTLNLEPKKGVPMKILVCLKQVPELEADVAVSAEGRTVVWDDSCEYRMNRYDEFAVEAALQLREVCSGEGSTGEPPWSIDLVTVGPQRAADVLRRGMGMGADRGYHLLCADAVDPSPFQVAGWIATALPSRSYDLILTGALSEDLMQGQTGPVLAAMLGIPAITAVISIDATAGPDALVVSRELEGGERTLLQSPLPVLLAVQPGINRPRYPSLSHLLRANRTEVDTIAVADLATVDPRQQRVAMGRPGKRRAAAVLEGTLQEKAAALKKILQRKAVVT
jgi:electron transfer flavoprotein beta subunit